MLAGRPRARAGDADVDRDGEPALGARRVDRVVQAVVERELVDEWRDSDELERAVSGYGTQARELAGGTGRAVGHDGDDEPVTALAGGVEHVVEGRVRQRCGDHADVHPAGVHRGQEDLGR